MWCKLGTVVQIEAHPHHPNTTMHKTNWHPQTDRQSWLQPSLDITVDIFFFFFNFNSELGDGFALTSPRRDCGPLKPLSPLVLVVRSSSARLMLTYVKNYTSPKLSQSAPASHWLLAAAAAPENEWNWNSCYITCTIPGSAVLHSIILYQNGHSGTEPPQIVSTTTFPERSRFVCFCMLSVHLKTLKFPDISQHDYQHIYTCNAHSTDGDNVSGCESALKKSYIYSWRGGGGGGVSGWFFLGMRGLLCAPVQFI